MSDSTDIRPLSQLSYAPMVSLYPTGHYAA